MPCFAANGNGFEPLRNIWAAMLCPRIDDRV